MGRIATKVKFQTVGCRLNQYETEKMAADLAPFGLVRIDGDEPADLYIINTCTVTHRADKDCRHLARKARKDNPQAKVVLVGCYVETDPESIAGANEVDAIIRNDEKGSIAELLPLRLPDLFGIGPVASAATPMTDFYQHNRAWIKISDGCNQECSFCLVTIVRGRLTCRPTGDIIEEVRCLVAHGYNEVVLTGVNIGYFKDGQSSPAVSNLAELCRAILDRTQLRRIRLSSIEPQTVTDQLLGVGAQSVGRICRHWHVPLQSGSDRILKLMRRPYTREHFLERLRAIKATVPGAVIGIDIIVGFPSETEEDFAASREVARSGLVDYLHVFSYSNRPGTVASELPEKIGSQTIRRRVKELQHISGELWADAHRRHEGLTLDVICENRQTDDGRYRAVADNYLKVRMPQATSGGRQIYRVQLTRAHADCADCEIAD
ncbi:MAG: tRNA (N(6)-L-threonylcarbamoyladenosine(37)-C(2))-methylthiotransferase MtaB [bacterium]